VIGGQRAGCAVSRSMIGRRQAGWVVSRARIGQQAGRRFQCVGDQVTLLQLGYFLLEKILFLFQYYGMYHFIKVKPSQEGCLSFIGQFCLHGNELRWRDGWLSRDEQLNSV
jgi:hypothetical protein